MNKSVKDDTICPECYGPKYYEAKTCMACYLKRGAIDGDMKRCTACGKWKLLVEFNTRIRNGEKIPRSNCKPCGKQIETRKYIDRRDTPEKRRGLKNSLLKKYFKISLDDYIEILYVIQDGKCVLCNKIAPKIDEMLETDTIAWPVDHDHRCCEGKRSCGKCIRGVLCAGCNRMLGGWEDMEWREKALSYLDKLMGEYE